MPAVSQAQQRLFAIAEHHPEQLHAKHRGMLHMSQSQLHDFAATPRTSLPAHKGSGSTAALHRLASRRGE